MKLFTEQQYQKLIENGKPENRNKDHAPITRLHFLYSGGQQCLISELYEDNADRAFGLYDDGRGVPKLAYINLRSLDDAPFAMNDVFFTGKYPMSVYHAAAKICDRITDKEELLRKLYAMYLTKRNA